MNKLHQAIDLIEQSASVRDHAADVRVLELLRAHAEDDICFGEQYTKLLARIQHCSAGHEYLADSHEYPCPACDIERREEQMDVNFKFVFNAIEQIHENICSGHFGTWQERVKNAVDASKKVLKNQDKITRHACAEAVMKLASDVAEAITIGQ